MSPNDPAPAESVEGIDLLLVDLLERVSAGEANVLDTICRQHPDFEEELRERYEALREMNLLPTDSAAMAFPERLGNFRLVRRLGGGGMGVVYEAVDEAGGRVVALKLIRPEHLYFPRAKERFRRETEAVSRLSHPGIVALYSVGEEQGSPYLAMELVEGATLQQALEQFHGVTAESLTGRDLRATAMARSRRAIDDLDSATPELFAGAWVDACVRVALRVSEAVEHAHGRGILHRDIKPSNIIVTPDGRAVLVDFGLAGLESEGRMTLTGATLGSVLYMSPEQVAGRANEIDARTDVYALGVTLYELLALQPPYSGADAEQTRAAILEGQPASIRARSREVSRELEIVCLKALERDRARRYATMADFGRDLRAVLEGRPILARPASAAYRAWRWVKRHPTTSTAVAAALALAIVAPTSLYVGERRQKEALREALTAESAALETAASERARADAEAKESETVSNFLVSLFGAADPYSGRGRNVLARDVLAAGLAKIDVELKSNPELQVRLLERIGESLTNLDLYEDAVAPLERALAMRTELGTSRALDLAHSMVLVASARRLANQGEDLPLLREALAVIEREGAAARGPGMNVNALLAFGLIDRGENAEANEQLDALEHALAEAGDISRTQRWNLMSKLASGQQRLGRFEDAERTARAALALDGEGELKVAPHPFRAAALDTLALSLREQGRVEDALAIYDELVPLSQALYGENNIIGASHRANFATVLRDTGHVEQSIEESRTALEVLVPRQGYAARLTVSAVRSLAYSLSLCGRFDEAIDLLEEAVDGVRAGAGDRDPANGELLTSLGHHLLGASRPDGARRSFEAALKTITDGLRPAVLAELALAQLRAGDAKSADRRAREALESSAQGDEAYAEACYVLAQIEVGRGEQGAAREWADRVVANANGIAGPNWPFAACAWTVALRDASTHGAPDACARAAGALKAMVRQLGPAHAEIRAALEQGRRVIGDCPGLEQAIAGIEADARSR